MDVYLNVIGNRIQGIDSNYPVSNWSINVRNLAMFVYKMIYCYEVVNMSDLNTNNEQQQYILFY